MDTTFKITHGQDAAALFNFLKGRSELAHLCTEAEANLIQEPDAVKRSQQLIQVVTSRVFHKAQKWTSQDFTQPFTYDDLSTKLVELQQGNFLYRMLRKNFEASTAQNVFLGSKFENLEAMRQRLINPRKIEDYRDDYQEIKAFAESHQMNDRGVVCYQNCNITSFDDASSSVENLDLSHNRLNNNTQDFSNSQVRILDLSYNQLQLVPLNLPETIQEFRFRGNDIRTLNVLTNLSNLTWLDISYMPNLSHITEAFWENIGQNLTIVISPDMSEKIAVPESVRDKVAFVSSLDKETELEINTHEKVVCPKVPLKELSVFLASSSNIVNRKKSISSSSRTSINWRVLGFAAAVIGVLGFLIHKVWSRAKA